jgi:hypothetical protein
MLTLKLDSRIFPRSSSFNITARDPISLHPPSQPHGPIKNAAAQEAEQEPKAALHDITADGAVAASTVPKTAPAAE